MAFVLHYWSIIKVTLTLRVLKPDMSADFGALYPKSSFKRGGLLPPQYSLHPAHRAVVSSSMKDRRMTTTNCRGHRPLSGDKYELLEIILP